MRQRTNSTWSTSRTDRSPRLRVLVESADPALAISDFAHFGRAGIDVALCSGPVGDPDQCPLVRGEPCALAAGADAILFGAGPERGRILDGLRRRLPGTPIVVQPPLPGFTPATGRRDGYEVLARSSSVAGQISALRQAAAAGRSSRAAGPPA